MAATHPRTALVTLALALASAGRAGIPADYRGRPFDDAGYRAEQKAEADRPALPYKAFTEGLTVWSAKTSVNGSGWVAPGEPGATVQLDEPDADGGRSIHFHVATGNYRQWGFGWNWAAPQEAAVNLRDYAAVTFSLKITGPKKMQELFLDLGVGQPACVSLRPFEPNFADGSWHKITVPLRGLKRLATAGKDEVRGFAVRSFVWNPCDVDVYVGDFRLDRETRRGEGGAADGMSGHTRAARGQEIPGRVECAFFDLGGEGVAYHDTTPMNTLSGVLNQQAVHERPHATPYHWNFRKDEGVDVSYAKDFADLNHTNRFDPPVNQLYIGGAEDGEWCNYTVRVKKAGTYKIVAVYGNVAGVKPLRFFIDGKPSAECPCPVVTAGMHKWTREQIGAITFPKSGSHLLTLHYERGYNLAYFEFEPVK